MRQIRMLRAMRRELETGLRRLLHGHAGGNSRYGQGVAYGLPRQFPTLPTCQPHRVVRVQHRSVEDNPGCDHADCLSAYSVLYMGAQMKWNYLAGFGLIVAAVFIMFKTW